MNKFVTRGFSPSNLIRICKKMSNFAAFLSCVTAGVVIGGFLFSSGQRFFSCGLSCSSTTQQLIPHGGTELVNTHPTNHRCLSRDEVEEMIKEASQVVVVMPAKAAGTTMKAFTRQCMQRTFPDNFLNNENEVVNTLLLGYPIALPRVIASHMETDKPLIKLVQQLPRSALLIYNHREETDRLKSAINHVYSTALPQFCNLNTTRVGKNTTCHVSEKALIETIKARANEIGIGDSRLLTRNTYEAITDNAPNMIFAHYKQAGVLQHLLSKYHCPHMLQGEVRTNVAAEKKVTATVHVGSNKTVDLRDWVDEKADMLQFALGLREDTSSQSVTRKMEDYMFNCQSGYVRAQ